MRLTLEMERTTRLEEEREKTLRGVVGEKSMQPKSRDLGTCSDVGGGGASGMRGSQRNVDSDYKVLLRLWTNAWESALIITQQLAMRAGTGNSGILHH